MPSATTRCMLMTDATNMFGNSIARRVNKVIKARVKAAQQKHDEKVKEIEESHRLAQAALEETRDRSIEESATALVESIIGKI